MSKPSRFADCHKSEPHYANGDCYTCYTRKYVAKRRKVKPKNSTKARCHPEREHVAKGLCDKCYMKNYSIRYKRDKGKSRKYSLEYNYGISVEEYEAMYSSQNGKCLMCEQKLEALSVDHDHSNGKIRGLLCNKCNLLLAQIEKYPAIIENTRKYLNLC